MRWAGHVECMVEKYDQGFGRETRAKETTRVDRRIIRTKMNLEERDKEDFDLIILAQDGPSGRVLRTR
jgi:hypothetical protein